MEGDNGRKGTLPPAMDAAERKALRTHRRHLKKSLFLNEGVLDYLVSKDVIGESTVEQIIQSEHGRKRNNSEQAEELLKNLPYSCSNAFETFIEALSESHLKGHEELATTLVGAVAEERSAQATLASSSHVMAAAIDFGTQQISPTKGKKKKEKGKIKSVPLPDQCACAQPQLFLPLPRPGHHGEWSSSDEQMMTYQRTSGSYRRRLTSPNPAYRVHSLDSISHLEYQETKGKRRHCTQLAKGPQSLDGGDEYKPDDGGGARWEQRELDQRFVHGTDDRRRVAGRGEAAMYTHRTSSLPLHVAGSTQKLSSRRHCASGAPVAALRRSVSVGTTATPMAIHLLRRPRSVGFVDEPFSLSHRHKTSSPQHDSIGREIIETRMEELQRELLDDYGKLLEELTELQAFTSTEVLQLRRMSPQHGVHHFLMLLKTKDSSTFKDFLMALIKINKHKLYLSLYGQKKRMMKRLICTEEEIHDEIYDVSEAIKHLDRSASSTVAVKSTSFDSSCQPNACGEEVVSEALRSATCYIMIDEAFSRQLDHDAPDTIVTLLKEAGIDPKKCTTKVLEFAEANILSVTEPNAKRRKDSRVLVRIRLDISLEDELLEKSQNAIKKCLEGFLDGDEITVRTRRRGSVILVVDMSASAVTKLYGTTAEQPGLLAGLGVLEIGCLGRLAQVDVQACNDAASRETCDDMEFAKTSELADKFSGVLSEQTRLEIAAQNNFNAAVEIAVKAAFPDVDTIQRIRVAAKGLKGVSTTSRSAQPGRRSRRRCGHGCEFPGPCDKPCVQLTDQGHPATHGGRHDCGAEHGCPMACEHATPCKRLCTVPVAPGLLRHAGIHLCGVHGCSGKCPHCGHGCNRVGLDHGGLCDTVHGTVSKATLETTYKSDGDVVEFPSNDVQCDTMCRVAGDSHYHLAKDCKCSARQPPEQRQHDPASRKDFISHGLFWLESGFKDPYVPTESEEFNICPVVCTLEGHDGANMPRRCTGKIFHQPVLSDSDRTGVVMGPGQMELSGHKFPCTEHGCGQECLYCDRTCSFPLNHAASLTCVCGKHVCREQCTADDCDNRCTLPDGHGTRHKCDVQQCTAICARCRARRCASRNHAHFPSLLQRFGLDECVHECDACYSLLFEFEVL